MKTMSDTVKKGQASMQDYPAQTLTLTGYVRTGTLRRSWSSTVQAMAGKIIGIVGSNSNIAPYNRLGQGKEQLTAFDIANWPNVFDLKKRMGADLEGRLNAAMERLFRRA